MNVYILNAKEGNEQLSMSRVKGVKVEIGEEFKGLASVCRNASEDDGTK